MRRTALLCAVLAVSGCLPTSYRRRPGSDIVLPTSNYPMIQSKGGVTCLTLPTPGITSTLGTGTSTTPTPSTVGAPTGASVDAASRCVGKDSTKGDVRKPPA